MTHRKFSGSSHGSIMNEQASSRGVSRSGLCHLTALALLLITGAYGQTSSQPGKSADASLAHDYRVPVFAESERFKKVETTFPVIERIYKEYAEKNHFPGVAFGVIVDGKLVCSGASGYTDAVKKTPVDTKSRFRIASMTKSFTAMAILKLRDEGKLKLDDPASMYIPVMKNISYLTADAPQIT